jgi:hypothetical protein
MQGEGRTAGVQPGEGTRNGNDSPGFATTRARPLRYPRRVGALLLPLVMTLCAQVTSGNAVLSFREFIVDPPVVRACYFREIIGPAHSPITTNYFFVAWQPNAVLVRLFENEDSLALSQLRPPVYSGSVASRVNGESWCIDRYSFTESRDDSLKSASNRPDQLVHLGIHISFERILNGGLQGLDRSTITWTGNTFTANAHNGATVTAELVESNSLPAALHVQIRRAEKQFNHVYVYSDFTKDTPEFLPGRIERRDEHGNTDYVIEIATFVPSDKPLAPRTFRPEVFFHRELTQHIVIDHLGNESTADFQYFKARAQRYRLLFLLLCLMVPATSGALLLLRRKPTPSAQDT